MKRILSIAITLLVLSVGAFAMRRQTFRRVVKPGARRVLRRISIKKMPIKLQTKKTYSTKTQRKKPITIRKTNKSNIIKPGSSQKPGLILYKQPPPIIHVHITKPGFFGRAWNNLKRKIMPHVAPTAKEIQKQWWYPYAKKAYKKYESLMMNALQRIPFFNRLESYLHKRNLSTSTIMWILKPFKFALKVGIIYGKKVPFIKPLFVALALPANMLKNDVYKFLLQENETLDKLIPGRKYLRTLKKFEEEMKKNPDPQEIPPQWSEFFEQELSQLVTSETGIITLFLFADHYKKLINFNKLTNAIQENLDAFSKKKSAPQLIERIIEFGTPENQKFGRKLQIQMAPKKLKGHPAEKILHKWNLSL